MLILLNGEIRITIIRRNKALNKETKRQKTKLIMCCDILDLLRILQWGVGEELCQRQYQEKDTLVFSLFCKSCCTNMFSIETVDNNII